MTEDKYIQFDNNTTGDNVIDSWREGDTMHLVINGVQHSVDIPPKENINE